MKNAYHYTESGLRNIWLANGYVLKKTKYGEGVAVHDVEGLHRVIAQALANKPHLTGAEVRFLRKEMSMSQRGLGELMGVTDQAVALWEKKGRLPKTADRLLRLIYIEHENNNVPIQATIKRLNDLDQEGYDQIIAKETKGRWETRLAA